MPTTGIEEPRQMAITTSGDSSGGGHRPVKENVPLESTNSASPTDTTSGAQLRSRPRRNVISKTTAEYHGLLWTEEKELKKALYASLCLSKSKAARGEDQLSEDDDDEDDDNDDNREDGDGDSNDPTYVMDKDKRGGGTGGGFKKRKSDAIRKDGKDEDKSDGEDGLNSKRTKVHAQRKFAQGSNPTSPTLTPVKQGRPSATPAVDLHHVKRPMTEDFLTFLCLRGTPLLPSSLEYLNTPTRRHEICRSTSLNGIDVQQSEKVDKTSINKSPSTQSTPKQQPSTMKPIASKMNKPELRATACPPMEARKLETTSAPKEEVFTSDSSISSDIEDRRPASLSSSSMKQLPRTADTPRAATATDSTTTVTDRTLIMDRGKIECGSQLTVHALRNKYRQQRLAKEHGESNRATTTAVHSVSTGNQQKSSAAKIDSHSLVENSQKAGNLIDSGKIIDPKTANGKAAGKKTKTEITTDCRGNRDRDKSKAASKTDERVVMQHTESKPITRHAAQVMLNNARIEKEQQQLQQQQQLNPKVKPKPVSHLKCAKQKASSTLRPSVVRTPPQVSPKSVHGATPRDLVDLPLFESEHSYVKRLPSNSSSSSSPKEGEGSPKTQFRSTADFSSDDEIPLAKRPKKLLPPDQDKDAKDSIIKVDSPAYKTSTKRQLQNQQLQLRSRSSGVEGGDDGSVPASPVGKIKEEADDIPRTATGRPSRKTKEAATAYLELLGRKLNASSDDYDFEMPDRRHALAASSTTKVLSKSNLVHNVRPPIQQQQHHAGDKMNLKNETRNQNRLGRPPTSDNSSPTAKKSGASKKCNSSANSAVKSASIVVVASPTISSFAHAKNSKIAAAVVVGRKMVTRSSGDAVASISTPPIPPSGSVGGTNLERREPVKTREFMKKLSEAQFKMARGQCDDDDESNDDNARRVDIQIRSVNADASKRGRGRPRENQVGQNLIQKKSSNVHASPSSSSFSSKDRVMVKSSKKISKNEAQSRAHVQCQRAKNSGKPSFSPSLKHMSNVSGGRRKKKSKEHRQKRTKTNVSSSAVALSSAAAALSQSKPSKSCKDGDSVERRRKSKSDKDGSRCLDGKLKASSNNAAACRKSTYHKRYRSSQKASRRSRDRDSSDGGGRCGVESPRFSVAKCARPFKSVRPGGYESSAFYSTSSSSPSSSSSVSMSSSPSSTSTTTTTSSSSSSSSSSTTTSDYSPSSSDYSDDERERPDCDEDNNPSKPETTTISVRQNVPSNSVAIQVNLMNDISDLDDEFWEPGFMDAEIQNLFSMDRVVTPTLGKTGLSPPTPRGSGGLGAGSSLSSYNRTSWPVDFDPMADVSPLRRSGNSTPVMKRTSSGENFALSSSSLSIVKPKQPSAAATPSKPIHSMIPIASCSTTQRQTLSPPATTTTTISSKRQHQETNYLQVFTSDSDSYDDNDDFNDDDYDDDYRHDSRSEESGLGNHHRRTCAAATASASAIGNSSGVIAAPAYFPNAHEFMDPLTFIEKIRPDAEKFGICKIVPPLTFKPECKVSNEMRFTAHNQYVHKMFHRRGPNEQKLACIRKHLEAQGIELDNPPLIGGMELDLPRLFETVQSYGGLKAVIEKKKWQKVADSMKIAKSAQDRVTKLYDAYCKFLLPYDTLSAEEKLRLEHQVCSERQRRRGRTAGGGSGGGSNASGIGEHDECVTKGRSMSLSGFYRIARNTMAMWFKNDQPKPTEVEQEYWRCVTERSNHLCVNAGNIDSSTYGYGFPTSKSNPFSKHPWNLKVLTNNQASILRFMGPVMGVTIPTIHVGMVFTTGCWYADLHSLPWIEFLHSGASKIWYGVPASQGHKFREAMSRIMPDYCTKNPIWLPSDTAMVPPNVLVEHGASLCRLVQNCGEFVVVFPRAFTSTVCCGYSISESVYFAGSSWLAMAPSIFQEIADSCEPAVFPLQRLIIGIAADPSEYVSIDVLKRILPILKDIRNDELSLRKQLYDLGLKQSERTPVDEIRNPKRKPPDDTECEICRANCYISLVRCSQDAVVYCLRHAVEHLHKKKKDLKFCKLFYLYDQSELNELVRRTNESIAQVEGNPKTVRPTTCSALSAKKPAKIASRIP